MQTHLNGNLGVIQRTWIYGADDTENIELKLKKKRDGLFAFKTNKKNLYGVYITFINLLSCFRVKFACFHIFNR